MENKLKAEFQVVLSPSSVRWTASGSKTATSYHLNLDIDLMSEHGLPETISSSISCLLFPLEHNLKLSTSIITFFKVHLFLLEKE